MLIICGIVIRLFTLYEGVLINKLTVNKAGMGRTFNLFSKINCFYLE